MNLVYVPVWSARLLAALACVLLIIALVRWRGEGKGGWLLLLRLVMLGGLVWVLFNPQALLPRERTEKPKLMILVDTSASMATADAAGEQHHQPSEKRHPLQRQAHAGPQGLLSDHDLAAGPAHRDGPAARSPQHHALGHRLTTDAGARAHDRR